MARSECAVEQQREKNGGCTQGTQVYVGDRSRGKGKVVWSVKVQCGLQFATVDALLRQVAKFI